MYFSTELEKYIVKELFDKLLIKFYIRYVDDTLLLVKEKDINLIQKRLNSFDKNIKFTVDSFSDGNTHFLDIQLDRNHTSIYYKPTHTGQYTHFHSQTPWPLKTAWIKSLFLRAKRICSTNEAFNGQVKQIKKLMSWNSYPKRVRNSLLKRLSSNINKTKEQIIDNRKKVWLNLPYLGDKGDHLTKGLIRKLNRCFKENVKFIKRYNTKKLAMFCSSKDQIQFRQKANVIYRITCPGCFNKYIGKTDQNIITRIDEHGTKPDQPMYQHLTNCAGFEEYLRFYALPDMDTANTIVSKDLHMHNAVIDNTEIIDYNDKWAQLQYLEAYYIKTMSPEINVGLKASKELQLFK